MKPCWNGKQNILGFYSDAVVVFIVLFERNVVLVKLKEAWTR